MGMKYTAVSAASAARPPGRSGAGARPARPVRSVESVKRSAEQMNKYGAILKKFGMKILFHNHAGEFDLLDDGRPPNTTSC